jgi:hypothetical protein
MKKWLDDAARDAALMGDFRDICDFGGRLAGSGQDDAALDWAMERLREIGPDVTRVDVPYDGWRCIDQSLQLLGEQPAKLECYALLRSQSTPGDGLVGEVLDLGLGRPEDFERAGSLVQGKIVLVRHEYPFATGHMHRRRKYDLALAQGAAGFLIANPLPGKGVLSGSSGRPNGTVGIPAAYVDYKTGHILAEASARGVARVRLTIIGAEREHARAGVVALDIPGGRPGRIVLSAHIDGHDLGSSAIDNASGVAVALAAARTLAGRVSAETCGLRVCFFSAEEWALAGSARYLQDMAVSEREQLLLNINLDTVAGDDSLTALISDFPLLEGFVQTSATLADVPVATCLPLMPNSDHANFARHGIPALRLVAGFDRPESRVNNILSAGDVPAIALESELRQALRATCAMLWTGLISSASALAKLAQRTI